MNVKVNLPAQKQEKSSGVRTFKGDLAEFVSFLSEKGEQVTFYRGYVQSDNPALCEFILTIPTVKEVTNEKDLVVPVFPERRRSRNRATPSDVYESNTSISHLELLQRAVASTSQTPQAAESTSTGA